MDQPCVCFGPRIALLFFSLHIEWSDASTELYVNLRTTYANTVKFRYKEYPIERNILIAIEFHLRRN